MSAWRAQTETDDAIVAEPFNVAMTKANDAVVSEPVRGRAAAPEGDEGARMPANSALSSKRRHASHRRVSQ